nr:MULTISPECIES: ammonium transporter [unclassified Brevundimonas]
MTHTKSIMPGLAALACIAGGLLTAGAACAAATPEVATNIASAAITASEQTAPALFSHQVPLELDAAATSWLGTSTALVLLMTLPGLALFYGGMVRRKNVIATITQSVASFAVVTLVWMIAGYTIAFGVNPDEGWNRFVGSFDALFLNGVTKDTAYSALPGIPEYLWLSFQLTFAIITPALITGAFAERIKYSGLLLFIALWSLIVYAPIAHWVWGGGFLGQDGVLDFAGGAVVHVNSGVAGLVCAIFLGARKGYGVETITAHNPVLTMIGASLLLVGWIGFNAGSAGAADGLMAVALINTLVAAAAGSLSWKFIERIEKRKWSLIGVLSGIVAGLVGITPAAGFVSPMGALIIGLVSGPVCYISSVWLKKLLKYDDSLDAFGLHGAGGLVGALLTGVLATTAVNDLSEGATVLAQFMGLVWTILWSAIGTLIVLVICKYTVGLRVNSKVEDEGLDTHLHGEALEPVS